MKTYHHLTADQPLIKTGLKPRLILQIVFLFFFVALSSSIKAQLGVYEFTGAKACPTQNPNVTTQPANAVFSSFTTLNTDCKDQYDDICTHEKWNKTGTISLTEYHQFTITANANYTLNLTSFSFAHIIKDEDNLTTQWILRSSVDNYTTDLGTGVALETIQTPTVLLPAANFTGLNNVTFRIYLINSKDDGNEWAVDNVSLFGSVVAMSAPPPNPTSDSPKCAGENITITASGTPPAGETWYWQTSATGTSTANSASTYVVNTAGTYYLRSQNNTTLEWSAAASVTVTISPNVGIPVFSLGTSSSRCQGAGTVTYSATATNNTGITYSLDAASLAAGNSINSSTGAVTYVAGWTGTTIITSTATGCNGPQNSTHTVTTSAPVGAPVFALGANSFRCLGASTITFTATALNATNITYSLDLVSALTTSINATTGAVTFGGLSPTTTTITATANGCNGPRTATHVVTANSPVGLPLFVSGATSSRCQGAGTVTYTANAANSYRITYSLDATSTAAGNSINPSTGAVTYVAGWSGASVITASAAGCNGPRTANHTATTNLPVTTPVFTLGATSTRCQGAGLVTYTATASNATSISYTLNAAATSAGNTISSSGVVSYVAGWAGTTIITATANGCAGPTSTTHTVTITPTVQAPVFIFGATTTRCQGAGTVTYMANAANATAITYSLDAASVSGGNSIVAATGDVTYVAGWSGTSTITATAAGCNGPASSTHTVTITPSVTTPVFSMGVVSTRVQGAGTVTYSATASNTTGITYTLDAASIAGGNTINASTGAVNYSATWGGTTIITASAAGCNGPRTSIHTVTINTTSVVKQLYLSDPSQSLDRVDPVNTADATTANTAILSTAGTTSTTFTMNPALCDSLRIKAGTITVRTYVTISSGTMPANPNITALLQYGATTIITLTNPTYSGGLLTWTGTLAADVPIAAGQAISLRITTAQAGVNFRIDFDSQTKPSRIDLRVSTFINITSLNVYNAAYPGGIAVGTSVSGVTRYIRATVTDPFGTSDITGMNVVITPTGSTVAATSVATSGCTRTYEYVWNIPAGASGTYAIASVAREGYENTVTNTKNINLSVCTTCPPAAVNDSASGAGGTPLIVDVLSNDNDPNNNINPVSLAITVQPKNGSAYISNNTIVYLPNGTFQGKDTITYQICDLTSPTPLCGTAQVFFTIDPLIIDICGDATKTHTYYIPYPEDQSYIALRASSSSAMPSNNIRSVISIKVPYAGMRVTWDEWEDGYEANSLNPVQASTKVWGDGNPFNGIAPGYPTDILPAGASIILDNTMPANPRNSANVFYDGKDKVSSSGQLALTQVSGEPAVMSVQAIKTNITSTFDFGQSFTIPLGQNFNSQDFRYTALFIRAAENNTTINIDKDNNGTFETTTVLNEGGSYLINGGVMTGATVASDKPIGVELSAGGVDNWSVRNAPIFPATWYSHTYYTPVPTSDIAANNPKDSSVVMLYNSLNRPLSINWSSGAPASGVINVPAKSAVRFPLAYSATATYKFVNPTGESFTAIEIVDSYTPGGGANTGDEYDWAFNLISEPRLTDFATVAWAPGSIDGTRNDNPIWVTPTANTIVYVKYNGDISNGPLTSPCGLKYDVAITLNALNYTKIKDASDNDQGGTAIYTCNGAKIAAVYGEDPSTAVQANPSWDVGATIQPFCKEKLIIATDDYATSLVGQPVTISVLNNDFGFLGTVDPTTVSVVGMLQPKHGTVSVNGNGSILYIPTAGFSGVDTFEYRVCSTPSPIVCDVAEVVIRISTCPSNGNQNVISGQVYQDRNEDQINNDGGAGLAGVKIYLHTDGNCNGAGTIDELTDSTVVDASGFYQFAKYPEKTVEDNFDAVGGGRSCENGSDGDTPWASDWTDEGDASTGFCKASATADVEIVQDGAFGYVLRLKDLDKGAKRSVDLSGASKAFLSFSYRRKNALAANESVYVQASSNGSAFTTIYTIDGGSSDANYVTIYNQDISSYASATSAIRFRTDGDVDDNDTIYIDNVSIRYLKYPQCYIVSLDSTHLPANYTATTAKLKTVSINGGGTCSSQVDFGLTRPNVIVSGRLRVDANGVKDNLVNGSGIGQPNGQAVYAYLADPSGFIAFKTTLHSTNGTYSFPLAEISSSYIVRLSTINVAVGTSVPTSFSPPAEWAVVGDAFGTNNAAGTGVQMGIPDGAIPVTTGLVNVTNVDFGIEQVPESDDYLRSVNQPRVNDFIVLNGLTPNPPVLSGADPEDCLSGCNITGKSVIIDTVPFNSELYYSNDLVTDGKLINNFNPDLLQIKVTSAAVGDITISFWYSYVDAAGVKDPSPAKYTVMWGIVLPSTGLTASVNLNNNEATINWHTLSEQNTSYFEVEQSFDNTNFTTVSEKVDAAGNSTTRRDYQSTDNIERVQHSIIYYRIKLVDISGKVTYSNIATVRLSKKPGVTVWPNPFQSTLTISITTEKETTIDIKLIDVNGRTLQNKNQKASKGVSMITLTDLEKLPSGVYLVEITDKSAGTTFQKLIKNN